MSTFFYPQTTTGYEYVSAFCLKIQELRSVLNFKDATT